MESDLPKVLHLLAGKPMVIHALEKAQAATGNKPVLVVGYGAEQVKAVVGDAADYVYQTQQLGTGHAVQQTAPLLQDKVDLVLVTSGDMPLLSITTLRKLISTQEQNKGPITMLTVISENPRGFGRVVRDTKGFVQAIVEEPDATPEILAIKELNAGAYCFRSQWLWDNLQRIPISSKGEYYLTDMVGIAVDDGLKVLAICSKNVYETIGVNTLAHLREAERVINYQWDGKPLLVDEIK